MKYFLLAIFFALSLGSLLGFSKTQSFFSDEEKVSNNILSTATVFDNGTPTPTPSIANHLVVNEVYYDVDARTHGNKTENDPINEWIEIYNPTNSAVPFKDWQICDNNDCVTINPNVSVPALGFALVSRDGNTWNFWTIPGGVEKIHSLGGTPLALANPGDRVILKNTSGTEIDKMSWGTDITGFSSGCSSSCPSVVEGHSLERNPDGVDTDTVGDFVDRPTPTPGS